MSMSHVVSLIFLLCSSFSISSSSPPMPAAATSPTSGDFFLQINGTITSSSISLNRFQPYLARFLILQGLLAKLAGRHRHSSPRRLPAAALRPRPAGEARRTPARPLHALALPRSPSPPISPSGHRGGVASARSRYRGPRPARSQPFGEARRTPAWPLRALALPHSPSPTVSPAGTAAGLAPPAHRRLPALHRPPLRAGRRRRSDHGGEVGWDGPLVLVGSSQPASNGNIPFWVHPNPPSIATKRGSKWVEPIPTHHPNTTIVPFIF